jgi:hypothetical protein
MQEKEVLKLGKEEVTLDPSDLEFNEATLTEYMEKEGSFYNYYSQKTADAQAQVQLAKLNYDVKYAEKFKHYKPQGMSDKLAEAHAKSDNEVVMASKQIVAATRTCEKLKYYLKSWDKNHDNAQSVGYMLRKEMDKLNFEIKKSRDNADPDLEDKIAKIVSKSD